MPLPSAPAVLAGLLETQRQERLAAFALQNQMPADVADAVKILVDAGIGTAAGLNDYLSGKPGTEINLPSFDLVKRPNQSAAYNLVVSNRAVIRREPTPDPVYSLPDPNNPGTTLRTLTAAGPMAVAQFQREHPDDFERLQRVENNRMAGAGRPLV